MYIHTHVISGPFGCKLGCGLESVNRRYCKIRIVLEKPLNLNVPRRIVWTLLSPYKSL